MWEISARYFWLLARYTVESYIDFIQGQTRTNKKLEVHDETIKAIVQKVLMEEKSLKKGDVFYTCARNWGGLILPGLVVTTQGHFYVCSEYGVFRKPVSQKDRLLYHDYMHIHAPIIVFATFTTGHPGLNGESQEVFHFSTRNRNKH